MGYGYYALPDGREAGYSVEAECDREGCTARIDRGLGYLCGRLPDGHRDDDEPGCGRYFCGAHEVDHDCPNPDGTELSEGGDDMGLTKHGQGEVLREPEETAKTASKDWTPADQQALAKENADADDEEC